MIHIKLFERGWRNFHRIRIEALLKYFCFISQVIRRSSFTIVCRFFLSSLQLKVLERWRVVISSEPCICPHRDQVILRIHTRLLFATCLFVKQLFPSSACFRIRMDPSWTNVNEIHCNDAVKFLFLLYKNSSKPNAYPDSVLIKTYTVIYYFIYYCNIISQKNMKTRDSKMTLAFYWGNKWSPGNGCGRIRKKKHTTWLVTILRCVEIFISYSTCRMQKILHENFH